MLASAENIESVPDEPTFRSETKDYTILVVDDNMELVDYLTDAMRPYFKDVRTAYNGEEALEMCRQWHPDVIISDIQMPKMNGYELSFCLLLEMMKQAVYSVIKMEPILILQSRLR